MSAPEKAADTGQVTRLLASVREGNRDAIDVVFNLVYAELHSAARRQLARARPGQTLETTVLVHEAYLKLVGSAQANWTDRSHFFAVAAKAMRQILVNHAHARNAEKRGGGATRIVLADELAPVPQRDFDAIALDEALKGLAALDERKASVVELRFFSGLSVDEVAHVLNVSKTTVEADWRLARAWLSKELKGAAVD